MYLFFIIIMVILFTTSSLTQGIMVHTMTQQNVVSEGLTARREWSMTAQPQDIEGIDTTTVLYPSASPALSWRVHGSAFYSLGSYTTNTISRNTSAFITLEHNKRSFYSAGYQTISFSRDDLGQNYFLEYTLFGKGLWWLGDRLNASLYYAYDHQNEIPYYFPQFTFNVFGVSAQYWFNQSTALGASYAGALQTSETELFSFFGNSSARETDYAVHIASAHIVHSIGSGIWLSTSAIVTDAKWAGTFFYARENIHVRLGKYTSLKASAGLGRRAFYLDEELLLLFDQPEVQTGGFSLGSVIGITENIGILPAIEYDLFDDYNITYGSLGVRISY
ncbi:MAG: hypothetical protein EPO24_00280 [Bacteroidetes bacterium]|nr:MAG: hypothetical protein EPO24_00280 [Bacteroidota bacterium]